MTSKLRIADATLFWSMPATLLMPSGCTGDSSTGVNGASRDAPAGPFLEQFTHRHGVRILAALQDGEQEQVLEFAQIYGLI